MQGRTKSCGCLRSEITSKRNLKDLTLLRFGKLTAIERWGTEYTKGKAHPKPIWLCLCDCGGHIFVRSDNLLSGTTKSCGCIGSSYGEYQIEKILRENRIKYQKEYTYDDLVNPETDTRLRFDFAILNKKHVLALIEFQGKQHYEEAKNSKIHFGELQRNLTDNLKREYCKRNNIRLLEIKYDEDIKTVMENFLREIVDTVPSAA